ncbi:MAG: hypothetical protein IPP19_04385 [Verrucomicrobia bacterium]|nr:hypothetical protein [Verrucomicrobiota bacterium]
MSLINDALKKAQQARADQTLPPTEPTPPVTPLDSPTPDAPRPSPPPVNRPQLPPHPPITWRAPNTPSVAKPPSSIRYESEPPRKKSSLSIFWLSLGTIAVIAISVRLTVMFTRSEAEPTTTTKPAAVAATPTPVAAEPQATAKAPKTETPSPATTLAVQLPSEQPALIRTPELTPVATASTPETAPAITFPNQPATAKPETAAPVVSMPTAPAATAVAMPPAATAATSSLPPIYAPRAPAAVNPSARIQSFIDRLRVSGIRMSTTGSKVILNDRLFKAGDMVDPTLELRLVKIEQGLLTFSDLNGKQYIKLFQ